MYDSEYGYIQNFIDYLMQILYMIMDIFGGLFGKKEDESTEATTEKAE